MAPLAARTASNEDVNVGGMPPFVVAAIIIAILLGGAALVAFWMFWSRNYRALIQWWRSKKTASSSSAPSTSAMPAPRARGGGTHPTASLPRFAHNLSVAMHLPLPKSSPQAGRPMSTLRASPIGMGPSHTRRGSEASMNSTVGLLRASAPKASAPTQPKPAFLGRGVATGQGLMR